MIDLGTPVSLLLAPQLFQTDLRGPHAAAGTAVVETIRLIGGPDSCHVLVRSVIIGILSTAATLVD
jgi:hypothetical protein